MANKYSWIDKQDQRREGRRPKPVRKWYHIPFASRKRARQNKTYSDLRKEFLGTHPVCEVRINCLGAVATEVHHEKGRTGSLLTDVRYFRASCQDCHTWVENNPEKAKELEFSVSRLNK